MIDIVNKKVKWAIGVVMAAFIVLILGLVVVMNIHSTQAQQQLLEDSIEKQLLSITMAARDILDIDTIDRYNSLADVEADFDNFAATREKLRALARETGADFIYVLKVVGDEVMFVMDTDEEDESVFIPYDTAPVHEVAFTGQDSAGVMNVVDEYGSYNTAAIPLFKDGRVIAIVSTDIEDYYLKESNARATRSQIILVCAMLLVLCAVTVLIIFLLTRVARMQKQLAAMARRDTVTGLPNRQYLLEYLQGKTQADSPSPFALFFIDLDNFKLVNDTAGHDAGDELLRNIAKFLESGPESTQAFRPAPGALNIAARIGGDEFVLVVDGIETGEQAIRAAQDLLAQFSSGAFSHYEQTYGLGLSIGIALYPQHTRNYHVLIKYADMAMYHAKHAGKNDYRLYQEDMQPKMEK